MALRPRVPAFADLGVAFFSPLLRPPFLISRIHLVFTSYMSRICLVFEYETNTRHIRGEYEMNTRYGGAAAEGGRGAGGAKACGAFRCAAGVRLWASRRSLPASPPPPGGPCSGPTERRAGTGCRGAACRWAGKRLAMCALRMSLRGACGFAHCVSCSFTARCVRA